MKKAILALLAVMLLASLAAACASGNNNAGKGSNTPPPAAPGNSGDGQNEPEAPKEPATIHTANLFPNLAADAPVMAELASRANVTFQLDTVSGDRNQKFDLWLASGDYPNDLLVLKPDYIAKYRDAGAIIPLNELIEQYGQNIKEKYGEYFDLLKDENGDIYSLYVPNIATEPAPQLQAPFAVRYDVLEAAGYPELKTLDQLFDILQDFYAKNPTIDGKAIIPWSGFSYYGNGAENFTSPTFDASGLTNHGAFKINDDSAVELIYTAEETKAYIAFLNKLNRAGMLDKEYFTLKSDEMTKKITEGRVLAGYFPDWWVQPEVEKAMRAAGDTDHLFAYFPLQLEAGAPNASYVSLRTRSNWNWAISSKSQHPEDVIKLLDYIFSDEAQILINWGIEGQHYEVVDGKRAVTEAYKAELASNPDALWSGHASIFYGTSLYFAHGTKLGDGDYATPTTKASIREGYDDRTKQVLDQYGKEVWSDFLPEVKFIAASLSQFGDVEDVRAELTRINQTFLKESANMVLAKSDEELDKLWNDYVAKAEKDGKAKIEEAYTALWRNNIK